jgi:hypothetical protein
MRAEVRAEISVRRHSAAALVVRRATPAALRPRCLAGTSRGSRAGAGPSAAALEVVVAGVRACGSGREKPPPGGWLALAPGSTLSVERHAIIDVVARVVQLRRSSTYSVEAQEGVQLEVVGWLSDRVVDLVEEGDANKRGGSSERAREGAARSAAGEQKLGSSRGHSGPLSRASCAVTGRVGQFGDHRPGRVETSDDQVDIAIVFQLCLHEAGPDLVGHALDASQP